MRWKFWGFVACVWLGGIFVGYAVANHNCERRLSLLDKVYAVQSGLHEAAAIVQAIEKQKGLCKRGLR